MAEELPVLVAALEESQARELEEASRLGRQVWVELKWPPAQIGVPHLLEIYLPHANEPLRLLAEPLGSSNEQGFALRLYPWDDKELETALPFPDVSPDQLIGRSLAGGRFEILSVIGEGSIGAVYRARHTGLGIIVAVKVLHEAFQRDDEFCRRFYAEALALSRLDHTNLVHVYDFGQEPDGLLFIAMALVDGRTLRAVLVEEKKIPEMKRVVELMLQVCAGLGHAHARGLIHRDVKPDNVMLLTRQDDDGNAVENVKVLDFGFAVPASVSGEVAQRLAGTPVYMSPEQCLGEELDARSDVYACGIMLYELATGTVPFLGSDSDAIRRKQIEAPPPLISARRPDVDPLLDPIVQRALSKARDGRHATMKELRADLRSLLGAVPSRPSPRSSRRGASLSVPVPERAARAETEDEPRASAPAHAIADALATDASSWLGELAQERDLRVLTARLTDLDGAVRVLAQRADARTLQMIAAIVGALDERVEVDELASATLAGVTSLFADPAVLAPIAKRLLSEEEASSAAAELLADARVAGAYALYGARTKIAVDQRARIAFVTTMKSLGESALPVVRAGLERIYDAAMSGEHQGASELAEDLLFSVPSAPDEVSGHLVVRYAESTVANLCRAAARALPRVWGERARPTLLRLLGHDDEGVLVSAIVGLSEIGAVDAEAVAVLAGLFADGRIRSDGPRAAALVALSSASGAEAHALAERISG